MLLLLDREAAGAAGGGAAHPLAALPQNPFPKRLRHLPRFDACPAVPHRGAAKAQLDARAIGELMGEIEALTEPVEHG